MFSILDVGNNMLHLHIGQQPSSLYMHEWVISPTSDNDAELNRQFPPGTDLNKILPNLLKLKTKVVKHDIKFSQHA